MNIKHCFLIILLVSYYKVNAQKVYTTEEGHIMMMTLVDDKPIKAESHKLALYLDYDSKALLEQREDPLILRFTGTIPSQDFLSKRHDPINFNWLIDVTYQGKSFKSQFKATITHIEQGVSMSCLISATGQLLVSNTGLDFLIEGIDDTIEVQFAQLVLRLE